MTGTGRRKGLVSLVSCVSDPLAYERNVLASLPSQGVERIPVDNRGNPYSAAQALNLGWQRARGEFVVFCHQDVVFPPGWTERLRAQIDAIDRRSDARWGVAGTFGRRRDQWIGHVRDRYGDRRCGHLPSLVETLDEHCFLVRRELGFRFDPRLKGFHLYGVDLCLEALCRGLANYAVDCCVTHLGHGAKNEDYFAKLHGPNGRLRFGLRLSSY